MAPEMAVGYIIGWLPSAGVTVAHIWLHRKKVKSARYRLLQSNLQKVQLQWRESRSDLEPFVEGKEEQDLKAYEKNLLFMGMFFLFLSWVGFFFNLIVLFSVHSLAISRKEQKVFASSLTERNLSPAEVDVVVKELS
ncbi:hypothetical protein ACES2L_05210 [Bdellovibrio bacteriovorus]